MRSCVNCKYSRDVGPYLACYAQKNAPRVDWDDVCKDWKPEHTTNADRIRAMTDEELAEWICQETTNALNLLSLGNDKPSKSFFTWFDWLQQEADDV